LGKAPKKLAGGPAPDLEDVFEVDDDVPDDDSEEKKEDEDEDDVTKDSLIKVPKKKGATGGAGKPKAKPKATKTKS